MHFSPAALANLSAFDQYHPALKKVGYPQLVGKARSGTDDMARNLTRFWEQNMKGPVKSRQMFWFPIQPYDPYAYFQ